MPKSAPYFEKNEKEPFGEIVLANGKRLRVLSKKMGSILVYELMKQGSASEAKAASMYVAIRASNLPETVDPGKVVTLIFGQPVLN